MFYANFKWKMIFLKKLIVSVSLCAVANFDNMWVTISTLHFLLFFSFFKNIFP